jgi:hypothetical protein
MLQVRKAPGVSRTTRSHIDCFLGDDTFLEKVQCDTPSLKPKVIHRVVFMAEVGKNSFFLLTSANHDAILGKSDLQWIQLLLELKPSPCVAASVLLGLGFLSVSYILRFVNAIQASVSVGEFAVVFVFLICSRCR